MKRLLTLVLAIAVIAAIASAVATACVDPSRGNLASPGNSLAYRPTPSNDLSIYATFQPTATLILRNCTNPTGVDLGEVGWEGNSGSLRMAVHRDCFDSAPWSSGIIGYYSVSGGETSLFVDAWDGSSAVTLNISRVSGTQNYNYYVNGVLRGTVTGAAGRNAAQYLGAETDYNSGSSGCTTFKTRISNMKFNTGWADVGDVWHRIVAPYTYVGSVSSPLP